MLHDLDLPTLEERQRQQRLTFLNKVVKGHVPAINIDHYLRAQKRNIPSGQNNLKTLLRKDLSATITSVLNSNQLKQNNLETLSSSEQHMTGIF